VSLSPLFERVRSDRTLQGELPDQDGSFYVLTSHGFRRNITPNLWDMWPADLERVPAADAGVQEFVEEGCEGLVPAVRINFKASDSVAKVLLHMNEVFWGPGDAPDTYLARKEHLGFGGCWGLVVQFRGV
jgi:hypothetical protein